MKEYLVEWSTVIDGDISFEEAARLALAEMREATSAHFIVTDERGQFEIVDTEVKP